MQLSTAELRRLREAGFTYKEISRLTGVPWGTIRWRCQQFGIKSPEIIRERKRPLKHDYPRWLINELYWECELSTIEIAYELDIRSGAVEKMMRRMGIPFRTRSQAWDVLKRRDRISLLRRQWTQEEAIAMAHRSVEVRKAKKA